MPDGSERLVKFDGIQSEFLIDRKFKVVNSPKGRAQLLRQSDALAQNNAIGIWETPDLIEKAKAIKMLKRMNVTNITVRVVEP